MRVPDDVMKCVVFVGIKDKDGRFLPRASGFYAKLTEHQHEWLFMITARHVVSALLTRGHDIWIRNNRIDGGVEEAHIPADQWRYDQQASPNDLESDVAFCQVSVNPGEDILTIGLNGPRSIAITDQDVTDLDIGIGDEVTIAGLFRSHYGRQQNVPILRIGHIAMMGGPPVWTEYCGYIEAHLIEAMSIGGLSGSPVFFFNRTYSV